MVVSGPPGSGKTTLAAAIAQQMRLPLVAKDLIKESLMSVLTISDVEMSKLIGRAAVQVMYSVAETAPSGAVLEANFHRSTSRAEIEELPGRIIEIFCRCNREVALARYRERTQQRHPGHFDERRTDDELWSEEVANPVAGGWTVIEVDTREHVDASLVVKEIERLAELQ